MSGLFSENKPDIFSEISPAGRAPTMLFRNVGARPAGDCGLMRDLLCNDVKSIGNDLEFA